MESPGHHLHQTEQDERYLAGGSSTTNNEQGLRAITAELLAQAPELSQHIQDSSQRSHDDGSGRLGFDATNGLQQSNDGNTESLRTEGDPSRLLQPGGLPLNIVVGAAGELHHGHDINGSQPADVNQLPFLVKNEIDQDLSGSPQQLGAMTTSAANAQSHMGVPTDVLQQQQQQMNAAAQAAVNMPHQGIPAHFHHSAHLMNPHLQHLPAHHLMHAHELAAAAAAAAASTDPRHHLHYGAGMGSGVGPPDCLSTQKAVAFLAGPRERIHVLGNPVEHCPRCQQEGLGQTGWRPHRHIGELKIRYICERHFDDLECNHHFDIPLCPICNQVLYLYDFNNMLGVSNARRLHKYVLKCANRHVLPLLDLFCQTKKGGERCNANFKLQWCYGTMVKRCEAQKNRDHDLWWVRYKNEWKQRRTIIRYKKDFLSHLTDAQRSLLLGLGLEGEPPPDPKTALGPTFDALVSSAGGSPSGPKMKKRTVERAMGLGVDGYDMGHPAKRRYRASTDFGGDYSSRLGGMRSDPTLGDPGGRPLSKDAAADESLRHLMGTVVIPSRPDEQPMGLYLQAQQQQLQQSYATAAFDAATLFGIHPSQIVTGTPTPPLANVNGTSPVAVSCEGQPLMQPPVQ